MTAPPVLSPREWEVVRRFALGQTYEQVAAGLGITRATVNSHRQRVSDKCGGGSLLDVLRKIGWLRIPGLGRNAAYTAPPAWRQG
jgi:FixJ family two-component response regulator